MRGRSRGPKFVRPRPSSSSLGSTASIGTAAHALHTLGARVVHHVTWEMNRECRAVLTHNWPQANLRGSFYDDAFDVVLNQVTVGLAKAATAGGSEPALVLATAGPPCPDFSRIRGAGATGRSGAEGRKIDDFIDRHLAPLRAHCEEAGLAFTFLIENVVMKAQEREHFDKTLHCSSFICEASDLGPVRRPRLWWTTAERELREVRGPKWATWDLDGGQAIPRLFAYRAGCSSLPKRSRARGASNPRSCKARPRSPRSPFRRPQTRAGQPRPAPCRPCNAVL